VTRLFFYFGWLLLGAAFIAGAAEPLATSTGFGLSNLIVPAYDLWYSVSPRTLVISQINIEKLAPVIWDPMLLALLQFPAWLLLGIPGTALAWRFRPYREISEEMEEDLEHYRQSLLVIEELSRRAREDEDYDPKEDDNAPVHLLFDLDRSEDEEMRAAYLSGDRQANYPDPDEIERWHENVGPHLTDDDEADSDRRPTWIDLDDVEYGEIDGPDDGATVHDAAGPWMHYALPSDTPAEAFGPMAGFVSIWRAKCPAPGAFPKWSDFDLRELEGWWGQMSLAEIHRDPLDMKWVLWGTSITNWWGLDYTNKYVSEQEHIAEVWDRQERRYIQSLLERRAVGFVTGSLAPQGHDYLFIRGVDLPLEKDGAITHFLSAYQLREEEDDFTPDAAPLVQV